MQEPSPIPRGARPAAVAAVLVMMLVAWKLGIFRDFSDLARAREKLLALGPWGYLAFVAAYAVLQPFGVPGTIFIWVAPMIWPWPIAFALSMVGTMAASVVGFSFARFVARDWLAERIPARFRRYDEALAKRAFLTVFTLRFIFWMPPLLHAFFGVSKVRFSTHFWASALGYIVPLLGTAYFGPKLLEMMKHAPAWVWIALTATFVAGLAASSIRSARLRREAPTPESPRA